MFSISKINLQNVGFCFLNKFFIMQTEYVSERVMHRISKHVPFLRSGFKIPYWVTRLLNAEGHLSIINAIVNRLPGKMHQRHRTLPLQIHPRVYSNCLVWVFPQLLILPSPGSAARIPTDTLRSWLFHGSQTPSLIMNSTWSSSWQTVPRH